jgi:CRISPR-associated protein Csm5
MATLIEKVKSSKQTLGEKIPCSIEILSPVHIGSGVKLVDGWDFIYSQKSRTLKIVSQEVILPSLSEKQLNEFNNDQRRREILSKANSKRTYELDYQRGEVLEFERNGNGTPYIPGSSFKGAIRTVLFVAEYNKNKTNFELSLQKIIERIEEDAKRNKRPNAERASNPILEQAFGKSSNENKMRSLIPSDIHFSQDVVEVSEVKILSLSSREATSFNYKDFSLYPEHLKFGVKGNFTIRIDEFLFKNSAAKEKLKFEPLSISDIAKAVNQQSKTHLEKEIAFFEKCGKDSLKDVIDFNKALLAAVNSVSNDEFILRLSWGSGWKGMTGDYLDENWLKTFRARFNLGKNGFPIFPKTRRIVFKDDKPRFTLGWIFVRLNHTFSESELKNLTLSLQNLKEIVQPKIIKPKPQGAVEAIVVSMEPPKAKVKILEGKYKDIISDLNIPISNLQNLGITQGAEIYVIINEQKNKVQSVQFKGLK